VDALLASLSREQASRGVGGLGAKPPDQKSPPQRAVSRILSAFVRPSASLAGGASADYGGTIIPLGPASLTGSSSLPGGFGRAVRLPIWPCSVRGLACHLSCDKRGALLPHLFTLTRLRPRPFGSRASARQALDWGLPRRSSRREAPRAKAGGMFSVPLSFGLPRPGVTRRTALRSSDFPRDLSAPRSPVPLRRNGHRSRSGSGEGQTCV